MGTEDHPLVNRVSADGIANIWTEDEGVCGGIATQPLDPSQLPDGCTIDKQELIGGGKRRFVIREEPRD